MARALLLASALLLAFASAASAAEHATLRDALVGEKLGNLAAVAAFVGAADELGAKGANITVFGPTDKAFDAFAKYMGLKSAADLLKPQYIPLLRYVLAHHLTFAPVKSAQLKDGAKLDVMSDSQVAVSLKGGAASVGGAKVTKADVATKDGGVLHVVDGVIVPANVFPDIAAAVKVHPEWSTFAAAATALAPEVFKTVADPATSGTILVPDNKAMDKFLEQTNSTLASIKASKNATREALGVVSYHLVPGLGIDLPSLSEGRVLRTALVVDKRPATIVVGRRTSADGKKAVELVGDLSTAYLFDAAEVYAGADVLYTIDDVLVPEMRMGQVGVSTMDVLKARGFTTFAKMIEKLEADGALSNVNFNGAVLAPTNEAIEAFAKRIGSTSATLLDRPGLLRELVGFHIVPDLSAQASKIAEAGSLVMPTVAGDNITFVAGKDKKSVLAQGFHGAPAALLDEYTAGRGKVYKIDKVLLPADVWPTCYEALEAFADAKKTGGKLSALKKAVDATPAVKKALQDGAFAGTLLAPGDGAFAALPQAAKDALAGKDGKKVLESVLLYHVLPAKSLSVPYSWPANATAVDTALAGRKVTLDRLEGKEARTSMGGGVPYQIAVVPEAGSAGKRADGLEYNLFCANAVVHAVDQVLLPKL